MDHSAVGDRIWYLFSFLSCATYTTSMIPSSSPASSCNDLHSQCVGHHGCSQVLHTHNIFCRRDTSGRCSHDCIKTLFSLLSVGNNREGEEFVKKCNCSDTTICNRHYMPCSGVVEAYESLGNTIPISCKFALLMCQADTECFNALLYPKSYCEAEDFQGIACTYNCTRALDHFYISPRALKLQTCYCSSELKDTWCDKRENRANVCSTRGKVSRIVQNGASNITIGNVAHVILVNITLLCVFCNFLNYV